MTAGALAPAADRAWTTALGRQVSAGLDPPPGVHSCLPAWWGRDHWCDVVTQLAIQLRPQVCRDEHVLPDTALRYARALSRYADRVTGRACRPTNERLMDDLGMSRAHLKRCRRVLERLGVLVTVVAGRSTMTRRERIRAWRNGSSHRRIAAEYALIVPRRPADPQAESPPVGREPPPREAWVCGSPPVICGSSPRNRPKEERPGGRTHSRRRPTSPTLAQVRTRRLAAGVQSRLGWLRATSPRRLTSLHRFAQQGWNPRDIHQALDGVLRARSWSVPDEVKQPAAYLATLLREVDEHDVPHVASDAALEDELLVRAWKARRDRAGGDEPQCPHGEPLGDEPIPGRPNVLACALCRAEQRAASTTWTASS